jgi:hypothetical protein
MMKTLRMALPKALMAAAISLIFLMGFGQAKAQPSNYCIPTELEGGGRYRCNPVYYPTNYSYYNYYYPNSIVHVKVYNDGHTPIDRESGDDFEGCYVETGVTGITYLGDDYKVYIKVKNMYYNYRGTDYCIQYNYTWMRFTCRLFIDWNADGDFEDTDEWVNHNFDAHHNRENNHPSNNYRYRYQPGGCGGYTEFEFDINISTSFEPGKRVMRVMHAYNYPYSYYSPENACHNGYFDRWSSPPRYAYDYGEVEDYVLDFQYNFEDLFPDQDDLLYAGQLYNGETRTFEGEEMYFDKPFVEFGNPQQEGNTMTFKIVGPLPSTSAVYTALDEDGNEEIDIAGGPDNKVLFEFNNAKGPAAVGGNGDFKSNRGGVFKVVIVLMRPGSPARTINKVFTVAWDDDLSARQIVSPKSNVAPRFFKYLSGYTIPFTAKFQNTGLNDITEFDAYARIVDQDGDTLYRDNYHYETPNDPTLNSGDIAEIEFRTFRMAETGIYHAIVWCDLESAVDMEEYNNSIPRPNETYTFEVAHEIQAQALDILNPIEGDTIIANRPIIPEGLFKNVGVGDISDVPATMEVVRVSDQTQVYFDDIIVQDIPSGRYNTTDEKFDIMIIEDAGLYRATLTVSHPDDPVPDDNEVSILFYVDDGFRGVYTVGQKYAGGARNFETIKDVMDALYLKGITGPIVFEFTDAEYNLYSPTEDHAAWDLTSHIIGLGKILGGERATITFRPARERSVSRGAVTINLHSKNGKGVFLGQSIFNPNLNTPFRQVLGTSLVGEYANSAGYITFDGGKQKALRFKLFSDEPHGAVIYLNRGSEHITVKNCLLENGTPSIAENVWVPQVLYHPQAGWSFEADTSGGGALRSYSAGIVNRNTLITIEESDYIYLDTIPNNHNNIVNNEIHGFGYGIVSLGIGTLYLQNEGQYGRFYNDNNVISGNEIYDVARAGILVGYEEETDISNNRIYNVGNGVYDAAGIMLGGNGRGDILGYNNIECEVNGNEISEVRSPESVHGIRVEQVRHDYMGSEDVVYFPDIPESISVKNNIIWGLNPGDADAPKYGIQLFTEREDKANVMDELLAPVNEDYYTRNDLIANNTIVINNDSYENSVPFAGLLIQQTEGLRIYNNAIAMEDDFYTADNPAVAGVIYFGKKPQMNGFSSDYNVYSLGETESAIYRYIMTDEESEIVEYGSQGEFASINQWQFWTGEDMNSYEGNFMEDMYYTSDLPASLRVISDPQYPLGSILNNRGENLDDVEVDIDGNIRGQAGQRYDVGAIEFNGRMYVSDVSVNNILSPGAYRSQDGEFSDAEYIMTLAPIEIESRLRNNGALEQSGIQCEVRIYRETPMGDFSGTPVITEQIETSIPSTETVDVDFNLADNIGTDFYPETYSDLEDTYPVPERFSTMIANVTPRYKIEVEVEADQDNDNNVLSKEVRFYLVRSSLGMALSVENSTTNLEAMDPTVDQIAGRVNFDSLFAAIGEVGWTADYADNKYDFDVFERTSWEPKAVDYTYYRTLFWSDGDDEPITRYQRNDLNKYLDAGVDYDKKNLIIASQEMVRENDDIFPDFVAEKLRAEYVNPGNPLGAGVSNDGNKIVGVGIERNMTHNIMRTQAEGDAEPLSALMSVIEEGVGTAQVAFKYAKYDTLYADSTMGVASTNLINNVVLLGTDWRHFGNNGGLIRGVFDYIVKNGGSIVPIELAEFNAKQRGKAVELSWTTISENNSSHFEIERAEIDEAGRSAFTKIDQMEAQGNSGYEINYGPIVDADVAWGNKYAYRLKMVDRDGQFEYSEEKVVTLTGAEGSVWMEDVRPNPASAEATFEIGLSEAMNVTVELFDVSGQKVATVVDEHMAAGSREITLNLRNHSSGAYTLVLTAGDVILTKQVSVVR